MRRSGILVLSLFIFLLKAQTVSAKLYINEFSSATSDSDWVEVYNAGPGDVDLSLYRIRDNTATNKLDLQGTATEGSFSVFDFGNKLNKTGDIIKIVLKSDELTAEDQMLYGDVLGFPIPAPAEGQTGGREKDGSGSFVLFNSGTKGSSNNVSTLAPSTTPTSAPASVPTATKAPTPTKTPTPVKTPTPIKVTAVSKDAAVNVAKKEDNTSKAISSREERILPTAVLGENTTASDLTGKPSPKPEEKTKVLGFSDINLSTIFIITGSLFLLACAILIFFKLENKSNG